MAIPKGQSCGSCKYWNQLTTKLMVDPNGIGNAAILGEKENKDWGQCLNSSPSAITLHLGAQSWPVVHAEDWCGKWTAIPVQAIRRAKR